MSEIAAVTTSLDWRKAWSRPWVGGLAIISLGMLAWVLWRASLAEVWRSLQLADYGLIALGIPVILAGLIFRALRWRLLLLPLGKSSLLISFRSMMVGYLVNNLLPMRAGELARAYVLAQQVSISKSAILATIVVERITDGLAMLVALSVLIIVLPVPGWVRQIMLGSAAVFGATLILLVGARGGRERIVSLLQTVFSHLPDTWQSKGVLLVDNFLAGLKSFDNMTDVLVYLSLILLAWSTDVLLFWMVMHAFYISLAVPVVVLVVAAGALSTMIPALPGSVGTYQFVLVNILTFFGVLTGPATAFALGVHGLAWLTGNIVSIGCILQLGGILRQPCSRKLARTVLD